VAVGVVAIVAAVALLTRPPAPAPAAVRPDASSPATASELPTPPAPIAPATLTGAAPAVGSIAVVDAGGALSVIAPDGRSVLVSGPGERIVGFPAWSSDGRRLAAIVGREATTTIELFPIDPTGAAAGDGLPVYRSSLQQAFYVAWLPGDRALSFLANDADVVDLRVADTDRTSPLDETDRGSLVRKGAPLYFDWLDGDQALLHVGVGPGAFLARVGRDGHEIGADLPRPGAFRSAQVSADGASLAYVREAASGDGAGEIVVRPLLGGAERTLPVFGQAALGFAPSATVVALIGADAAGQADLGFPLGPLRTLDAATGATRTLLDGAVVGWFWSPDGRTIFAIRLQVPSGGTADAGAFAAGSPSPVPSEVHALFVDVATGAIRADHVVRPGPRFVSEVLPYFDQYALSHRLWAPDSSSFLLPIVGADGTGTVIALPRDGSPSPFSIAATAAFWSP
jgi:TolB protein